MPDRFQIFKRLVRFLAPYVPQTVLAYAAMTGVTLLSLVVPALIAWVVDVGLTPPSDRTAELVAVPGWLPGGAAIEAWALTAGPELLIRSALALIGVAVVRSFFTFAQLYLGVWLSQQVAFDLRNRYFRKVQYQSFRFHDRTQTGDLMSRAVSDISKVQAFMGEGLLEAVNTPLLILGAVVAMFTIHAGLASVTLVPLLLLLVITVVFGRLIEPRFKAVQDQEGVISTRAQENFTGARVVKAFAREPWEIERFEDVNERFLHRRIHVIRGFADFFPAMTGIITATIGLVLWVGGRMVLGGEITLGTLVGFNFWVLLLARPTQNLGFVVNRGAEAIAAGRRLFEILDEVPVVRTPPDGIVLEEMEGRVTFDDVTFGYGERAVLKDIDLDVPPNRVVALFGPTGSGKSTLVSLIPRFYDVDGGAVRIDGIDVRELDLFSLRRRVSFVLQDAFLFSATVRENITYGLPEGRFRDGEPVTQEDVEAAARAAQAHDFIMEMPKGYDTLIGERGVTLSGGQRQRLAIARALIARPRILVLDDALSAVDTETEHEIQAALAELMRGRTTFIIAQRLLTLKHADEVVVLDDGRIVERGVHDDLVVAGGLYQRIYEMQLRDQDVMAGAAPEGVT